MKKALIAILSLLLLISVCFNYFEYQRYSSRRALIRMTGDVVTRKEYQDKVDHDYGKQVLNKLVYAKIIANAAVKAQVAPTEKDVDERLDEIDRRNSQLIAGAKNDPEMMSALRADLREDIGLENLRIKDIKVSDADVAAFYDKNKAVFAVPPQAKTTIVVAQNDVDAATAKGLLEQSMTGNQIARQPRLRVVGIAGFSLQGAQPELQRRISEAVSRLKDKEIATIPVSTAFLILRVDSHNTPGVPPLDAIKPFVTRLARLQKAVSPEIELAQLFRDANVEFEVSRYAPFFDEMEAETRKLGSKTPPGSPKPL